MVETFLPADYLDVYRGRVNGTARFTPDDLMVCFWSRPSRWVKALFKIRKYAVRLVGIKSQESENPDAIENCIRTGAESDFLSVAAKNEHEVVLRMADKHLDAYLSVYVDTTPEYKEVYTLTVVHFHNQLGRFYFMVVRPFHRVVVKSMLKRALRDYRY